MYCPNCGAKNDDGIKFCAECGTGFDGNIAQKLSTSPQTRRRSAPVQPIGATATSNFVMTPQIKRIAAISAAVVVVIILVVIFFNVGAKANDPQKVVTQYITDEVSDNYSGLYDTLAAPKGDFTSKAQFTAMMKNNNSNNESDKADTISSISIKESPSSSKTKKIYHVSYTTAADTSPKTETVDLIRQAKKTWLFFDTYKADASSYLLAHYDIVVPKDAKLSIDGVAVKSTYLSKSKSTNTGDEYDLTNIFAGNHNISVTASYINDYKGTIDTEDGNPSIIQGITPTQAGFSQMQKQAEDALNLILNAAYAQKSFSDIQSQLTMDSSQIDSISKKYQQFLKNAFYPQAGVTYSNFKISNFSSSDIDSAASNSAASNIVSGDSGNASSEPQELFSCVARCNLSYTISKINTIIWNPDVNDTPFLNADFAFENGKWVVYSIGISGVDSTLTSW
jgi:hypothetical protein